MWQAILIAGRWLLTASAGWAVSDIFNTYQNNKANGVNADLASSVKQATSTNWPKWIAITVVGALIYLIVSPFIKSFTK